MALISWVQHVQAKSLLKNGINLSDLFHPETFLNAFRQRNSRIMKVAIDELKLTSDFNNASQAKEGTIILDGLWLQGSGFQSGQLTEVRGQQSEIIQLPACAITWIPKSDPEPAPADKTVEIPVYHTLDREKLLCTFKMLNTGSSAERIISGVALFLNGSE